MTAEQLLSAYPEIRHAVSFVELFMCPSHLDDRDGFGEMVQARLSPEEVIDFIKKVADDETKEEHPSEKTAASITMARAEMDHPSFKTYIAGKMGCV